MRLHALAFWLMATGLGALPAAVQAADAADPQAAPAPANGRPSEPAPPNPPVIDPQLDLRKVKVPHIPSNDIELGLFTGTYESENFGSHLVGGVRLGYHITEDVFVEAVYGQTKVSDEDFRQILPGGIFVTPEQTLRYYDVSAGYNVLPGEIFLGHKLAKVSALYLIAGLGSTEFAGQRHLTFNAGTGVRVFLRDWVALQLDMRDHVFSIDLLGTRKTTQNLEFSGGVTFFF
jgi:outer membrane beta-barrel protein